MPKDFASWDNVTSKLDDISSNTATKYTIKLEPY